MCLLVLCTVSPWASLDMGSIILSTMFNLCPLGASSFFSLNQYRYWVERKQTSTKHVRGKDLPFTCSSNRIVDKGVKNLQHGFVQLYFYLLSFFKSCIYFNVSLPLLSLLFFVWFVLFVDFLFLLCHLIFKLCNKQIVIK